MQGQVVFDPLEGTQRLVDLGDVAEAEELVGRSEVYPVEIDVAVPRLEVERGLEGLEAPDDLHHAGRDLVRQLVAEAHEVVWRRRHDGHRLHRVEVELERLEGRADALGVGGVEVGFDLVFRTPHGDSHS